MVGGSHILAPSFVCDSLDVLFLLGRYSLAYIYIYIYIIYTYTYFLYVHIYTYHTHMSTLVFPCFWWYPFWPKTFCRQVLDPVAALSLNMKEAGVSANNFEGAGSKEYGGVGGGGTFKFGGAETIDMPVTITYQEQ